MRRIREYVETIKKWGRGEVSAHGVAAACQAPSALHKPESFGWWILSTDLYQALS